MHTAGPGLEKNAVTVWPHLRWKGARGVQIDARGSKKEPRGPVSWAPGRPQEGALGINGGSWKIVWRALETILGSSGRALAPFWVEFPLPLEVMFGLFLGTSRPRA